MTQNISFLCLQEAIWVLKTSKSFMICAKDCIGLLILDSKDSQVEIPFCRL